MRKKEHHTIRENAPSCVTRRRTIHYVLVIIGLSFLGCNLEEVNENPNVPTDAGMNLLLPSAQSDLANAISGRFFRYSAIASQQLQGTDNQELLMENYNPDELFVGYPWEDLYAGPMINLKLIIDKANEENSPAYSGIAKVLLANCIGIITDTWGDVPFSEALTGGSNLYPAYDSQESIYTSIQQLLDEAIEELQQPSPIAPGGDDLMFGGDLVRWEKAARALKARYYIHLTKKQDNASDLALNAINQAMTSSDDDLKYSFLGTAVDTNPINDFFTSTTYAVVDPQFIGLIGVSDPRFEYFVDIIPFTGGQSKVGAFRGSANSPAILMSYTEQKFIEAEARLRTGDPNGAQSALSGAVSSSFEEVENFLAIDLDDSETADFLASLTLDGTFEENLRLIIEQKHIALFTQHECWTDWRRSGYPVLEPNENGSSASNPGGEIPRRLIYPQSERLLNTQFPGSVHMQERLWWDD
jgi:hypothetical protein